MMLFSLSCWATGMMSFNHNPSLYTLELSNALMGKLIARNTTAHAILITVMGPVITKLKKFQPGTEQ